MMSCKKIRYWRGGILLQNKLWESIDSMLLNEVSKRYGTVNKLSKISDTTNLVYKAERNGEELIIRIIHNSQRKKGELEAEVDWILHLVNNGISTPIPLPSKNGNYIEVVNSEFLVLAFEKANGRVVEYKDWDTNLFQQWGSILGRLHALSKKYTSPFNIRRSSQRVEPYTISDLENLLPSDVPIRLIVEKHNDLMAYLKTLPKDQSNYGLIHGDFEDHNFFVNKNEIIPFDFDDCHYNWFIFDIVTVLRQASWTVPVEQIDNFLKHFLIGYRHEIFLEPFWIAQVPHFLKLKEITSYISAFQRIDFERASEEEKYPLDLMKNWIVYDQPWDGLGKIVCLLKN
jgi:Ser/Thr protein kinase RdoA (MazF antagonist)